MNGNGSASAGFRARNWLFCAAGIVAFAGAGQASIVFSGTGSNPGNGNNPLAASVEFEVSGSTLTVILTNTATSDVLVPSDVLTGVYWSMDIGAATLTPVSGLLHGGSTVFYDPDGQPAGGNIGGEFGYRSGLSLGGSTFGISSSGLGLFGPGDLFPGPDLAPPTNPDGLQYGLLSTGDDTGTGNGGITGSGGLIKDSVIFTISGLPAGFELASIGDIRFQYGTSLEEPNFPAPGSVSLLALGGLAAMRRRRNA